MVIIAVRASAMCHLFIFLLLNFVVDLANSLLEVCRESSSLWLNWMVLGSSETLGLLFSDNHLQ